MQNNFVSDNPLDVFGGETSATQVLTPPKPLPSGCPMDFKTNFRLAAIIAIVALVVGMIPIEGVIGKYIPLNRLPFGGGITKASMIGSISAILIGMFA